MLRATHAITHHSSMELLSTSDSTLIAIFKHQLPLVHGFPSFTYDHHQTAFIAQPLINMSNPDDLKSLFEDPSDIEMEDLSKPKCTLKLTQSSSLLNQPFNASSAPSWHSLLFLSLDLWYPLWFPSLH